MGAVVRNSVFYLVDDNGNESVVKLPPAGQARWSPDGRRVAVVVKAAVQPGQAVSVGDLVIVERGGRVMNKIPLMIRLEDGTPIGGLRFVENLIWRDNDTICAEGSANPSVGVTAQVGCGEMSRSEHTGPRV
jgi:hypothetical protein